MLKNSYEVNLSGHRIRLKSSHDEATVRELESFVQVRLDEIFNHHKNTSLQNAAVLAALNIAEELILLKRRARREIDRMEERALRISQEIEDARAGQRTSVEDNSHS